MKEKCFIMLQVVLIKKIKINMLINFLINLIDKCILFKNKVKSIIAKFAQPSSLIAF